MNLSLEHQQALPINKYRMATNFGEANIWRLAENLQLAKF